jgi:hypothetical protein
MTAARPTATRAGLLLAAALAMPAGGAHAQSAAGDVATKARTVVTFARFVQWPPGRLGPDEPALRLCVVHNNAAVAGAFSALAGDTIEGRRLTLALGSGAPAGRCHLLYVDASAAPAAPAALAAVQPDGALTLGSNDGFLAQGGMIELLVVDDRLRFDINLSQLRVAQLELHPGVLKLARRIRR